MRNFVACRTFYLLPLRIQSEAWIERRYPQLLANSVNESSGWEVEVEWVNSKRDRKKENVILGLDFWGSILERKVVCLVEWRGCG